jgi:hypothetical protein
MQPKRFPIGFWNSGENYLPKMEEWVNEWDDLGFSLAMTPNYGNSPEEVAQVRRLLDLAHAKDIEMILCDNRTHGPASPWGNPSTPVPLPAGYAEKVAAAVRDFGHHPAAWGLYVADSSCRPPPCCIESKHDAIPRDAGVPSSLSVKE